MPTRMILASVVLAAIGASVAKAPAEDAKYPDLRGAWERNFQPRWLADEPGQRPPLTPEYMQVYEANLADMANGGHGDVPSTVMRAVRHADDDECLRPARNHRHACHHLHPDQQSRTMPSAASIRMGATWPADIDPTFAGYSIGKWIDEDGDGVYDMLEIETRSIRGPHTYDGSGTPFHK